jgi:hypothetical protein
VATESAPLDAPSSPSGPADRVADASATEFGVHEAPPTDHHAESSLEDEPAQVADEQIQSTVSVGDAASAAPSAPSATGAHEVDTGDATHEPLGRAIDVSLHEPAPAESEPAAGSTSPGTGPPTVDAPLDPALEPQPVELTQPATTSDVRGPAPGGPSSTGAAPVEQGVTASRAPSPLTTAEPKFESATPVDVDSAPSPKPAVAEAPSAEVQIPPLAAPASAAAANAAQITSVLPMWSGPSRPAQPRLSAGEAASGDPANAIVSPRPVRAAPRLHVPPDRPADSGIVPAPPRCSCSRWLRSWPADRDACSAIPAQRSPRRSRPARLPAAPIAGGLAVHAAAGRTSRIRLTPQEPGAARVAPPRAGALTRLAAAVGRFEQQSGAYD